VTGSNDVIAANFIGTDPSGSVAEGNGRQGVLVNGANNTVYGTGASGLTDSALRLINGDRDGQAGGNAVGLLVRG